MMKKAQELSPPIMVFLGLLGLVMVVIIMSVSTPIINAFIDSTTATSTDVTTNFFLRLLPIVIVGVIVASGLWLLASRGG